MKYLAILLIASSAGALPAQSAGHPFPSLVGLPISYVPLQWPEGACNSRDPEHGRIAYATPFEVRLLSSPELGAPLTVRVITPVVSAECGPVPYQSALFVAFHNGNVMPSGSGILPDGTIRKGAGTDCSMSVVPQVVVPFGAPYEGGVTTVPLLAEIPDDRALVGFELYLQGVFLPDFNCGSTAPWSVPRTPDWALATTDVMRVEIQVASR